MNNAKLNGDRKKLQGQYAGEQLTAITQAVDTQGTPYIGPFRYNRVIWNNYELSWWPLQFIIQRIMDNEMFLRPLGLGIYIYIYIQQFIVNHQEDRILIVLLWSVLTESRFVLWWSKEKYKNSCLNYNLYYCDETSWSKAMWRGTGLFGLHFYTTVNHWMVSG